MDEEARLSAHIRHLLLDYVRCHITVDYVQYTQSAVAELVSLEQVPAHDPASLTLPTDPFTALFSLFKLGDLPPYQEKIAISQAARLLLKHVISLPKGKPRSERLLWSGDAWDQREDDAFYHVEPILTRRAIQETPVQGKTSGGHRRKEIREVNFHSYSSLMTSIPSAFAPINVPPIQEPEVKLDQVLDVTYHLKASDHTAVRALLKSASTFGRPQTLPLNASKNDYRRMYLPANFDFDQPRHITPPPDSPPLVPIFARKVPLNRNKRLSVTSTGRGMHWPLLRSMEEIPECIVASGTPFLGIDGEEMAAASESLSRENMIIVDGWQTYATSSPSTVYSADDDEIDELKDMFPSSPDTEVSGMLNLVRDIEDSKLEEVQIPRNRRVGGDLGQTKETIVDKATKAGGLGTFLAPLVGPSTFGAKDIHIQGLHPLLQENLASMLMRTPSGGLSAENNVAQSLVESPRLFQSQDKTGVDVDSLCGQASVCSVLTPAIPAEATKEEGDEIRGLYQDLSGTGVVRLGPQLPRVCVDPKALIRDERLFDDDDETESKGDQSGTLNGERVIKLRLMPVPLLPEPNEGAKARVNGYSEYLVESGTGAGTLGPAASKATNGDKDVPPPVRFLKSAKGIAPLRVALSWIPFTRTDPMPAHGRILGNDLFDDMDGGEALEREVRALLAKVCADSEGDPGSQPGGCGLDDQGRWKGAGAGGPEVMQGDDKFSPEIAKCEIILTKAERRALLAREGGRTGNEKEDQAESVNNDNGEQAPHNEAFDDNTMHPSSTRKTARACDEARHRPAKRARLSIEDSGIGMMPDLAIQDGRLLDFNRYPNCVLEDQNAEVEDTNDMLCGILADGDEMLTESSHGYDEDHNKENDPPTWPVERNDHDFYIADTMSNAQPRPPDPYTMTRATGETLHLGREPEDWNYDYDDDGGGSFEPLSLSYDSRPYQAFAARHRQPDTQGTQSNDGRGNSRGRQERGLYTPLDMIKGTREQSTHNRTQPRYVLGDIVKPAEGHYTTTINTDADAPDTDTLENHVNQPKDASSKGTQSGLGLATHALGISGFTKLRAKKLASEATTLAPSTLFNQATGKADSSIHAGANQQRDRNETNTIKNVAEDLYDSRTLRLPSPWTAPITVHKYMASIDLLQKQVLVRSLASQKFLVELVERESLDGADLIIDPHTAVIFSPLLSLPALKKTLLVTLSAQTWRFKRVLVVFEAYPSSRSCRSASRVRQKQGLAGTEPELHAYTPPVVKAIKRFRRDLNIAEGCGKKAAGCEVWCAFADSVEEAATYTRLFGEEAERRDCAGGAVWGLREWLDIDMSEDEANLASLGGMNRFSASVVLCQMTLQDFLDLRPEQRITAVGPLIGSEATNILNADLEQRIQAIESSELNMSQYSGMDIDTSTELSG